MKTSKVIKFYFEDDEISIVQRLIDFLDGIGENENWDELNAKATDMDALYVKAEELLDYMKDHREYNY